MAFVDQSQIVEGYWEEYVSRRRRDQVRADECFWACEVVDDAARHGSEGVLDLLVALADAAADDVALAYLGAGPVEDVVNYHGERLIDTIEILADGHPAFAKSLRGVNSRTETPAEKDVERRLQRFRRV